MNSRGHKFKASGFDFRNIEDEDFHEKRKAFIKAGEELAKYIETSKNCNETNEERK